MMNIDVTCSRKKVRMRPEALGEDAQHGTRGRVRSPERFIVEDVL
jgi:hypothetical protein